VGADVEIMSTAVAPSTPFAVDTRSHIASAEEEGEDDEGDSG
jgi:hypothetical protein